VVVVSTTIGAEAAEQEDDDAVIAAGSGHGCGHESLAPAQEAVGGRCIVRPHPPPTHRSTPARNKERKNK